MRVGMERILMGAADPCLFDADPADGQASGGVEPATDLALWLGYPFTWPCFSGLLFRCSLLRRGIVREQSNAYGQQGAPGCDTEAEDRESPLLGSKSRLWLASVHQAIRCPGPKESDGYIETN